MADAVMHPPVEAYEPPLLGTNSRKLGMWLFMLSDSLTFGALMLTVPIARVVGGAAHFLTVGHPRLGRRCEPEVGLPRALERDRGELAFDGDRAAAGVNRHAER